MATELPEWAQTGSPAILVTRGFSKSTANTVRILKRNKTYVTCDSPYTDSGRRFTAHDGCQALYASTRAYSMIEILYPANDAKALETLRNTITESAVAHAEQVIDRAAHSIRSGTSASAEDKASTMRIALAVATDLLAPATLRGAYEDEVNGLNVR
jgi:hypothetical protein